MAVSPQITVYLIAFFIVVSPSIADQQESQILISPTQALRLGDPPPEPERTITPPVQLERLSHLRTNNATASGPVLENFTVDNTERLANLIAYHRHYTIEGDQTALIQWNGNIETCNAGTIADNYHDLVRRRINYYRGQAGLPTDITFSEAKNAAAQEAAVVMVRQRDLTHTPFRDFPNNLCVTAADEVTASASNLALGTFGLDSIDRLVLDDGDNNAAVGHRRWFFYPRAQEMGHGSIPFVPSYTSACVVWVVGDFKKAPTAKPITWPNEGYCPSTLVPNSNATHPRWSFTYPDADFSAASVSMTYDSVTKTVIKESLQGLIGDNTIVWRPANIPATPPAPGTDSKAQVTVNGIQNAPFTSYTYTVHIYDPYDLQRPLTVTGPTNPAVSGGSLFTFNSIADVEGYHLKVADKSPVSWNEGAEDLSTITDHTSSAYSLESTTMANSGSKSFHLVFPAFGEQSFEIDRTVIPDADSRLQFKRLFRFFYPHSRLKAEISDNDGASWAEISSVAGNNSLGSSAQWETSWHTVDEPIPVAYHGLPVRLRIRIVTGGTFYQLNPSKTEQYGVFLDDIKITQTSQVINETVTLLAHDASSLVLDNNTAGTTLSTESDYLIQLAPIVGGHQFGYTEPLIVTPADITIDEEEQWETLYFGNTSTETGPTDDFDQDGISNLLERALGSNPTNRGEADGLGILPSGSLPDEGALSGRPSISFSIPASPHADLTYEVQQSQDFVIWTPLARKIGTADWSILVANVMIDEGSASQSKIPMSVGGPAESIGSSSVSLRLHISSAP
ncbi:MAG: hypothetical protein ACI9DF_004325 [Verrucomicrobiales bacterium]